MPHISDNPSILELVHHMREEAALAPSSTSSLLLVTAADILEAIGPGVSLSVELKNHDEELMLLARVEALLPENLNPRQMSLLVSYLFHNYRVPMAEVDVTLLHVRGFLQAHADGSIPPEAQEPIVH